MKDFEDFKVSRMARDPSTHKYTKYQWQKAYEAYQRTRSGGAAENAEKPSGDEGEERSRRGSGRRGGHSSKRFGMRAALLEEVRAGSAYSGLRQTIDMLTTIAIAITAVGSLLSFSAFLWQNAGRGLLVGLPILASLGFTVVLLLLARYLAHVLIDIPDIALYRVERRSETDE